MQMKEDSPTKMGFHDPQMAPRQFADQPDKQVSYFMSFGTVAKLDGLLRQSGLSQFIH